MLSKPKPVLSNEAREFIAKLAASRIWVLAVGIRGCPQIPDPADPSALEIVAAHRIDVSEIGEEDSLFPLNYARDQKRAMPFFSSKERATQFIASMETGAGVAVFQPVRLKAGFLGSPECAAFELIFDPGSTDERTLTEDERLLLRKVSAS